MTQMITKFGHVCYFQYIVDKSIPRIAEKNRASKMKRVVAISGRIVDSGLFVWLNVDKSIRTVALSMSA